MWTFCHSAHNFEYIGEAMEARREMEASHGEGLRPFTGAARRLDEQRGADGGGSPEAQRTSATALPDAGEPLVRRRLRGKQPPPRAYRGAAR